VGWLTVIGRLRHDVSLDVARDELAGLWRRMYRRSVAGIDTSAVEPGLAMGTRPSDIRREVTRRGLGLTGVGLLFGLSTALAGGHVIDSLLYGVDARDPLTLTAAPLALLAAATVGCALPAARASSVNPAIVLRDE
jgi:hypothetical protein